MPGLRIQPVGQRVSIGAHDDPDVTIRLVRPLDGPAYLVALRGAVCPWVLRRRYLVPEDFD